MSRTALRIPTPAPQRHLTTPTCAPSRHCCCRRLVARAGLLDLLTGRGDSSAGSLTTDAEGEALMAWLQQRGLPPQQVKAALVPGSGRGLVAAQAIGKGEVLLRIPRQLVLTPEDALQQLALRPLLEELQLPGWSMLAVWLAEQRGRAAVGDWWPYVRLLPQHTGAVLEWTDEEVAWLEGSQLHADALDIRAAEEASWQELQPVLAEAEAQGLAPTPGAFSRGTLRWAFGVLLARLVRLQELGGTEALLPWADLLNHDCCATAFLDWEPREAAVALRAERRYRLGEQLLISYGQKTSGELLLSYGFCPEPGTNPHDGCRLRLGLAPDDKALAWKAAALERRGLPASRLFPLRMGGAPLELVCFAALAAAQPGSKEEAEAVARAALDTGELPPQLRAAALETVVGACKAAQGSYRSSFDDDRAELQRLQDRAAARPDSGGEAERGARRRQVLQVLVHERQVLARTVFVMQQELRDLRRRG